MLPFHLRDTRHASKKGIKRPRCKEIPSSDCGGPVQTAVTADLIHLRKRFREALIDHTKRHSSSYELWKSGTAFSVFKQVFQSSKIGLLHLLPPARCDRESYSQLIYGTCLWLFKESFEKMRQQNINNKGVEQMEDDNECIDHYNDTGFAIFLLLALFETNPLPREISTENPLEFLPIGLRSSEDSRASNRRCFLKDIRIDRNHFALMLRLKELALARKCNGEQMSFELQRLRLENPESEEGQATSESNKEETFLDNCSYGMSTDIIEVLDRIIPRLEFCEYTGPVGAEAFAGHPEYPHNQPIIHQESDCRGQKKVTLDHDESCHIESSYEESTEIMSLLRKYKTSVAAIQIPQSNSNRVKHVQNALRPLVANGYSMDDTETSIQSQRISNAVEIEDHDDNHGSDETVYQSESFDHASDLSNCKLLLDRRINTKLKMALQTSVMDLLTRGDVLFSLSDIAKGRSRSSLDADDVSSIGYGGISIASRRSKQALLELSHRNNVRSRNGRIMNERTGTRKITKQSLANEFLTSKQTTDPALSDEDSVDSEITASSFSDSDSMNEDEVSIATSAFGKQALKDLLQNVSNPDGDMEGKVRSHKKRKARRSNAKKRQNKILDDKEDSDMELDDGLMSTATSAFGKRALGDLLKQAARKEHDEDRKYTGRSRINNQTSKQYSRKSLTRRKTVVNELSIDSKHKSANDDTSVATSAFGKKALDNLLKSADSHVADSKGFDEEVSVATSAHGNRALNDLLQHARSRTKKTASKVKNPKEQKRGNPATKDPPVTSKTGDEEASVATSAYGKRALDDLLQEAHNDDSINQRKRQKRKPAHKNELTQRKDKSSLDPPIDNEEISVATSAFGKRALEALLQNAVEDETK